MVPATADFLGPGRASLRDSINDLRAAYRSNDDDLLLRALPEFTERELRAAATLSPFETGKAGTFDWLERAEEIEESYLFFRKCLFYLGRGIPGSSING